jgi:tRNA(adenine34) deaminase
VFSAKLVSMTDEEAIALALEEAQMAASREEVPVGAVLLAADGGLLARDRNRILERRDPTAHAEMLVMRAGAAALDNERLTGTTLFVSLEPCAMCAGAMALARIARLVFVADDPKGGAVLHGPRFFEQPTCHHRPVVSRGGDPDAAGEMLKNFFRARRGNEGQEKLQIFPSAARPKKT